MDANDLANQTRQKAEAGLQTATEKGQALAQKARGTARDAGAAADLYVHEYAWTSMLLMTAVAGLLGYLPGARRR